MKKLALLLLLMAPPSFAESELDQLRHLPEYDAAIPLLDIPDSGDVFLVFAHADDELPVLGRVASLLEANPDRAVHWVVVSDGAKAHGSPMNRNGQTMAQIRAHEVHEVADCIGVKDVIFLNDPDGDVAQDADLSGKLRAIFAKAPSVAAVFTSDSRGLYGHPDHIAVYKAVREALQGPIGKADKTQQTPTISAAFPHFLRDNLHLAFMMFVHGMWPYYQPITHKFELAPTVRQKKACTDQSYYSQRDLISIFRKGIGIQEFYQTLRYEFYNVEK